MPRPKKEGAPETKRRSRTGCWACKGRKVKCDEEKPSCGNCVKSGDACDYSIRLNWGGRSKRDGASGVDGSSGGVGGGGAPAFQEHVFSAQHISTQRTPRVGGAKTAVRAAAAQTGRGQTGSGGGVADTRQGRGIGDGDRDRDRDSEGRGEFALDPRLPQATTSVEASGTHGPASSHSHTLSPPRPAPGDFSWSSQHAAKRLKRDSAHTRPGADSPPVFAVPPIPPQYDTQASPGSSAFTPHSINSIVNTPATPGTSVKSASPYPPAAATPPSSAPTDLRRLSVKSLLSEEPAHPPRRLRSEVSSGHSIHGYDHGLPDHDVPRNDDFHAVMPRSPDLRRKSAPDSSSSTTSEDEPDATHMAFEPGGYYAQPVPIRIAKSLEPLHPDLRANPMNLLYFHHFINHTGRITVPHDCPDNPFRTVLPQMAMRNTHLLHLLLAFSASHRARLLGHPEPENRIAGWMSDVLPALRQALDTTTPASPGTDPTDPSSLAPLATAIMLASREIITPATHTLSITWQDHLSIARRMIIAKGGLHHLAHRSTGARDKTIFFLSRWFAYLDVFGSLSGAKHHRPLSDAYLEDGSGLWLVNRDNEEVFKIDCFFGFSGRCIALLAQVAELAAECDRQRIDPITASIRTSWQPGDLVRQRAEDLRKRLEASITNVFQNCPHHASLPLNRTTEPDPPCSPPQAAFASPAAASAPAPPEPTPEAEIYATNTLFHLAGLLHLSRRVLNLPSPDPGIQLLVRRTLTTLDQIRPNSTAENCLLFPIFTAGCEAVHEADRAVFAQRLRGVEGWGMEQVARARRVMGRVWETGRGWEVLVEGEFLG